MRQSKLSNADLSEEDKEIIEGMKIISEAFKQVAEKFDEIELLTEEQAPHGLMEKARTISWLVEQIYVQNLAENPEEFGLESVAYPDDDLIVYDLTIELPDHDTTYYANVKTGLTSSSSNKNDVSKSSKLAKFFHETKDDKSTLLTIPVRVDFHGSRRAIDLRGDLIEVHNLAWLNSDDTYVNPSNKNLQCSFDKPSEVRSKEEFLRLLLYAEKGMVDAVKERSAKQKLIEQDELGFDYKQYDDLK
jgi:hypothetical protein